MAPYINPPFHVKHPRRWIYRHVREMNNAKGYILLGGITYHVDGKPKQAAAFFPEYATEEQIDRRKSLFIKLEQDHGIQEGL